MNSIAVILLSASLASCLGAGVAGQNGGADAESTTSLPASSTGQSSLAASAAPVKDGNRVASKPLAASFKRRHRVSAGCDVEELVYRDCMRKQLGVAKSSSHPAAAVREYECR